MDRPPIQREFAFAMIVQQKRLSRKMSWTTHPTPLQADRATRAAQTSRDGGRPYRFIYRVNVYAKVIV